MEWREQKPDGFEIGSKYRISDPNDNYKYHVIHNDEKEKIIIVKYFGKHKRWWHYEIWSYLHVNIFNKNGDCYRRVK